MRNFEFIARAVIMNNDEILLCKRKDRNYYFLPGGHVEFGETAEIALVREIREELGVEVSSTRFIGASENMFVQNDEQHHEINLIFQTTLASITRRSMEEHIEFFAAEKSKLEMVNLLPQSLARQLNRWFNDQKYFWVSQLDD